MKRVGLIGYGTIGRYLVEKMLAEQEIDIAFVIDPYIKNREQHLENILFSEMDKRMLYSVDLVVETAMADAVRKYAPLVLEQTDMLVFSVTAFADSVFHEQIIEICKKNHRRLYVPHGAILGLDGISDGKEIIKSVHITTTKSPKGLGRTDTEKTVVYDGSARGACLAYPRNVNVHAGVALASLGFDHTHSIIVSDPNSEVNSHLISVEGEGVSFTVEIASKPMGLVTGVYTPASAYGSIKRILSVHPGIQIV